jgi:electron transfer flavoprotein alpha subunit
MATFNNTDLAAFKDVWVFCEQRQGEADAHRFRADLRGPQLADELGVNLCGILLGDKVEGLAKELGGYGADKVVCDSPLLKDYTTDGYAKVICDVIEEKKPEVMLFGASHHRPRSGAPLRRASAHRPVRGLHASGRGHGHLPRLPAQQLHAARRAH